MRDDVISTSLSSWDEEEEKSRASFECFFLFQQMASSFLFLFFNMKSSYIFFFLYRCEKKRKETRRIFLKDNTQKQPTDILGVLLLRNSIENCFSLCFSLNFDSFLKGVSIRVGVGRE
jgi:hypothetical protein